jgi:hypothetical protein
VDEINYIYTQYQRGEFKDDFMIWRLRCLFEWKKVWNVHG